MAYTYTYADAYTDTYAYADAYTDTYAYANTYANTYADTDTYANTKREWHRQCGGSGQPRRAPRLNIRATNINLEY